MLEEDKRRFDSLADVEKPQEDQDKVSLMKHSSPLLFLTNTATLPSCKAVIQCHDDEPSPDAWCIIISTFIHFWGKADIAPVMMAPMILKKIDLKAWIAALRWCLNFSIIVSLIMHCIQLES